MLDVVTDNFSKADFREIVIKEDVKIQVVSRGFFLGKSGLLEDSP